MMNILIIEDEARIAKRIERMVLSILDNEGVAISLCNTINEGKSFIKNNDIDILFLDLNLNGEDGFQVLKSVVNDRFRTIIISAYKDKAITAFEYGVLDFIPKPFTEERLADAFLKIKHSGDGDKFIKYLAVNKKGMKRLIRVTDIAYIKGADVYSEIHSKDGMTYLHNMSLDRLSEVLPCNFERIHRSHIANMLIAKSIVSEPGSRYFLRIDSIPPLPIGRTKYKRIKEKWFL